MMLLSTGFSSVNLLNLADGIGCLRRLIKSCNCYIVPLSAPIIFRAARFNLWLAHPIRGSPGILENATLVENLSPIKHTSLSIDLPNKFYINVTKSKYC